MAAHALYLLSAEALAAFEQIQMKPGQEAQAVEKKSAQLKSLTDQLKKVIAYGNGRWTIASLYGLGRANHEMTEFIQNVPLPKGLSPAVMKQVKAKLQENAAPYKKLASTYFNQCIENSEKFEVFTLFAAGCVTKGNTVVREAQENTLVSTSSNQEPQGVERLRQKLYDDSRNIKLLNELASQYVRAKDYTMAIAIYIRSLEIDPKSAETMSALGMAYLFTNNLQDAGQSFSKALKLRSRDPHALWGLVALYKEFKFNSKYKSFLAKAKAAGQPKGPLPPLVSKVL
jgi:tetratricopeptide (TPR) repeat protein